MKFSLSWLKDHLETEADAATVAETLTRIGLEVEGVHNPAEALRPFRIGGWSPPSVIRRPTSCRC